MFSIKEQALYVLPPPRELPVDATDEDRAEAEKERSAQPALLVAFTTHPTDAAIKRLRVVVNDPRSDPAAQPPAVELSFNANGLLIDTEYNPQTRKAWDRTPLEPEPEVPQGEPWEGGEAEASREAKASEAFAKEGGEPQRAADDFDREAAEGAKQAALPPASPPSRANRTPVR